MLLYPRSKDRKFHLGPFALESLHRDERVIAVEASRAAILTAPNAIEFSNDALSRACDHYREIFSKFALAVPATTRAPVPDDLDRRSADVKGAAYFMDASCVGICRISQSAWIVGPERLPQDTAVVVMVEHPRRAEPDNLAHEWTDNAVTATADMRACEIGCCLAQYIRHMGFGAGAHFAGHQLLDMERLPCTPTILARLHPPQDLTTECSRVRCLF
jgi:hypothetical protein